MFVDLPEACRAERSWRRGKMKRFCRFYRVLAIESSCDDSAVCLIDRASAPKLIAHHKTTLDSAKDGGIIPIDAMSHHLQNLGPLVNTLLEEHGRPQIDLVCATQGPGMYSSLAAGLQLGKGLACAWNVPFVGVHHMLGHLLTPRFFAQGPQYPFISLLISGGHTLLVLSHSTTKHEVIAESIDIAAGNALDKCARQLGLNGIMLGRELDKFVAGGASGGATTPELNVTLPLEKTHDGSITQSAFSFAHFSALMSRLAQQHGHAPLSAQTESIRRAYGEQFQTAIFSHILRKTQLAIKRLVKENKLKAGSTVDFVVSGGVAANSYLRRSLHRMSVPLHLRFHQTPLEWCTDNALMIGWAGIELHESGYRSSLACSPTAKWPLDQLCDHSS